MLTAHGHVAKFGQIPSALSFRRNGPDVDLKLPFLLFRTYKMPNAISRMTQEEYGQVYQQGFAKTVLAMRCRGASTDHAEDLAQSAWLQGWRKLGQLRDKGALLGWINMIALNYHRRTGAYEARHEALAGLEFEGRSGIDGRPWRSLRS